MLIFFFLFLVTYLIVYFKFLLHLVFYYLKLFWSDELGKRMQFLLVEESYEVVAETAHNIVSLHNELLFKPRQFTAFKFIDLYHFLDLNR